MSPFRLVVSFFQNKQYRNLSLSTFAILLNGTIVFHFVEGWRWIDAIYFSVITLTTVGYGDLSPQTDFGKIFSIIYIFVGIGVIFGFINAFYEHRSEKIEKARGKFGKFSKKKK
ncbi:potassium channel family protein [Bacteroidales bacterium]|nr:potassium channel family protein [Bacteroidales bacterium]